MKSVSLGRVIGVIGVPLCLMVSCECGPDERADRAVVLEACDVGYVDCEDAAERMGCGEDACLNGARSCRANAALKGRDWQPSDAFRDGCLEWAGDCERPCEIGALRACARSSAVLAEYGTISQCSRTSSTTTPPGPISDPPDPPQHVRTAGMTETYRAFGRTVNSYDSEHFNGFWACTLQDVDLRNLNRSQDLEAEIHRRAQAGTKRYSAMVDQRCMPRLAGLQPRLDAVIAPEDMRGRLRAMSQAAGDLRDAWAAYIAFVGGQQEAYHPEGMTERERVNKIAKGWFDYRRSRKAVNDALRAKITATE